MTTTVDQTEPAAGSKWAFDEDVTRVFDNMLARSIPGYHDMRRLVFDIGRRYVRGGTDVLDIGCSRGDALAPFTEAFGANVCCIGLDVSQPMLEAARKRYSVPILANLVEIRDHDLRHGLPDDVRPSLTLGILTTMFVPPECRQRLFSDIYSATVPGGALVLVEKTLGSSADFDDLLVDAYHSMKRENGYTKKQIEAKRQSLHGVLIPQTAEATEAMLRAEGFRVQPFWRSLNFVGWVAVKPKGRA